MSIPSDRSNWLDGMIKYFCIFHKDSIIIRDNVNRDVRLVYDWKPEVEYSRSILISEIKLFPEEVLIDNYGYTIEYNPFMLFG